MLKKPLYVYGDMDVLKVPAHMHYGKHLLNKFKNHKEREAVVNVVSGETLTYGQLAQQVVDIALSLTYMGVKKGQVISICSEKRLEYLPTVLGIMCAGATYAAAIPIYGTATFLQRINLAKPSIIFCSLFAYEIHKEAIKTVTSIEKIIIYEESRVEGTITFKNFLTQHGDIEDFLPVEVNGWEDVAIILYSSGTSGLPKGIRMTHLNFILFLNDTGIQDPYTTNIKVLITRAWYNTYGLGHTLFSLNEGCTVFYCPPGKEDTQEEEKIYLEATQKYKIQILQVTPNLAAQLMKSDVLDNYDVSSLRGLMSSSIPFSAELTMAIKTRLPNVEHVVQYYAMSEVGAICSMRKAPCGSRPGSVGCVSEGFILKVVDLVTRQPLGPNQRGEICFKSRALMLGYVGDVNYGYLDDEGFFKTGDIGYYDDQKYFYIVDRVKELIKFNAYQVAPAELEAVLLQHPAVRAAGVIGVPHEEYGEVPTGFVVLQPGAEVTGEELVTFVNKQVLYCMRLEGGVHFVQSLPSVSGGKVDRKKLKKMFLDNVASIE